MCIYVWGACTLLFGKLSVGSINGHKYKFKLMFPRFVSAQLLIVAYMHSSILFQCVITQMSLKSKAIISRIGEEYIQCVCVCVCVVSEYAIVDSVHAHAHALQQLDYRSGTGRIYSIYLDSTHYTHLLSCQRIGHSCQCTNTQIHYHRIMFFSLSQAR